MASEQQDALATVGRCLAESVSGLTEPVLERRHEDVMAWAETEIGLERSYAEQIYSLAEEEELAPVFAFLLVQCGVGVRELERPEPDGDDSASQQSPPGWVGSEGVELDDVVLERRLRASFRRFRSRLSTGASTEDAVAAFLAEPDVGPLRLR